MAGDPARKRATYDDVLRAPPSVVAEVVAGVLYTHPRPAQKHALAASSLGAELVGPFQRGRGGPGGWIILDEPELHLGTEPDILVPDLAGWRRERLEKIEDAPYFTLAPDWICEVASPSTRALDRAEKLPVYAREQVRHAWIVEPLERLLEVYRLEGASWLRVAAFQGHAVVRVEPFEAIALELRVLWEP